MLERGLRVVIYNRCSTEKDVQLNALETQVAESKEIANELGWIIVHQYVESESGTSSEKRAEYKKLFASLKHEHFDVVMVKSMDRLMRSALDWHLFVHELMEYDKKLFFYLEKKFHTPDDRLLCSIKAALAGEFSYDLSKKIRSSHSRRQKSGDNLNINTPMFGWDRIDKKTFIINENEANYYRDAFALAEQGFGYYSIANMMYEKGARRKLKTGNSDKISSRSWELMLNSERAYGTVVYNKFSYAFDKKKKAALPEEDWIYHENALPPIISKEKFAEIQKILGRRKIGKLKNGCTNNDLAKKDFSKKGKHDLSHKLICGACGSPYYRLECKSPATGNKYEHWKCSKAMKDSRSACANSINIRYDIFVKILKNAWETACKNCPKELGDHHKKTGFYQKIEVCHIELALNIIRKTLSNDSCQQKKRSLENQLAKIKSRKDALFERLMDGTINEKDFIIYNKQNEYQIESIEKELTCLHSESQAQKLAVNETRLLAMKNALVNEKLCENSETAILFANIKNIVVHPNRTIEIFLMKAGLFSVASEYNEMNACKSDLRIEYDINWEAKAKREEIAKKMLELFSRKEDVKLKDMPGIFEAEDNRKLTYTYLYQTAQMLKRQNKLTFTYYGNHQGKWSVQSETE